jgi:hypothetical protein
MTFAALQGGFGLCLKHTKRDGPQVQFLLQWQEACNIIFSSIFKTFFLLKLYIIKSGL